MTEDDSAFIIALRNKPIIRDILHTTSTRIEDQHDWLRTYYKKSGDYYFLITQQDGTPEGTIAAIASPESGFKEVEWARWVVNTGSLAALESAMMLYQVVFDQLNADMLYCQTLTSNSRVVSFHTSCGFETSCTIPQHMQREGKWMEATEQRLYRTHWKPAYAKLDSMAKRLAARGTKTTP